MSSEKEQPNTPDIGTHYNDHYPPTMELVAVAKALHASDVKRQKEKERAALRSDLQPYVEAAQKIALVPR